MILNRAIDCLSFRNNIVNIRFNRRFTKTVTILFYNSKVKYMVDVTMMAGDDIYDIQTIIDVTMIVEDINSKKFELTFDGQKIHQKYIIEPPHLS